MNFNQRAAEPQLICTCNDFYRHSIEESIAAGCEDADEMMFDLGSQFRCEVCRPLINRLVLRKVAAEQGK